MRLCLWHPSNPQPIRPNRKSAKQEIGHQLTIASDSHLNPTHAIPPLALLRISHAAARPTPPLGQHRRAAKAVLGLQGGGFDVYAAACTV